MISSGSIIAMIAVLGISIHTISFGIWTWKKKNKYGAVFVFMLVLLILILPVYSLFIRE
jgi:hypothetical protein